MNLLGYKLEWNKEVCTCCIKEKDLNRETREHPICPDCLKPRRLFDIVLNMTKGLDRRGKKGFWKNE